MRIWISAVGRVRAGPDKDLYEKYIGRLSWPVNLREVEERRPLPPAKLKARESELLCGGIPQGAVIIVLDERGKTLTSLDFARKLENWQNEGRGEAAFLIGGASGLDDNLRARADLVLSLGAMTWPHFLVRALLAEQLYRAQSILAGHPYHREG
ncbi:MAG: 23S rRNA (pseudouridine(1915)-N(3))-methyltransferase RlmH [Rhodospirillaceae bacterium]|nr:23S rRNA (pseudouridine(1915)-N(3))-methyltransferase RlmH [Rhodospirillaceae bacterium]MBT5373984.1 23S rRNA (pseudouridine(1915)-N(3))-methyltransferase RlmH [Rhodospirillaceae bacterium]MBT5660405.1 23S rRNA (pseudouridine(1915)-N(3))-methyltransferase RlmH [Rhodospirillaceae bacterium]MBT5751609.1 23S rRNA (pseudouridine(1915)-N(3))-methyltransferase RlmH [Rhodospirillaceae bacterium]